MAVNSEETHNIYEDKMSLLVESVYNLCDSHGIFDAIKIQELGDFEPKAKVFYLFFSE